VKKDFFMEKGRQKIADQNGNGAIKSNGQLNSQKTPTKERGLT
jgi:hypothetical protein|tara:strand:- start:172 stop:300 length:129 start_codon:yes stop_codon:yes gene_type:complete